MRTLRYREQVTGPQSLGWSVEMYWGFLVPVSAYVTLYCGATSSPGRKDSVAGSHMITYATLELNILRVGVCPAPWKQPGCLPCDAHAFGHRSTFHFHVHYVVHERSEVKCLPARIPSRFSVNLPSKLLRLTPLEVIYHFWFTGS
jgi:hypothetical protein